ncbi:MAG: hypothetical protein IJF87_06620 [Erysipelotrichaceae bacterium]|nr:hypothetical protein [Erysipelotrichaceae bacterium]
MIRIISNKKAERIIKRYQEWIDTVAQSYRLPSAVIKAILYIEMTRMDILDPLVDLIVGTYLFAKKDSSTGYAQIFAYVGVNAVNFAVDEGLTDYQKLNIPADHRLDSDDPKDVHLMWIYLHRNPETNIEIAALNILSAAREKTGRLDFTTFSEDELKLVLTRYNANTDHITKYGEEAYGHYLRYLNN